MFSVIVPIYRNQDSITELLKSLENLNSLLEERMEVVFVVDGSPDDSYSLLSSSLNSMKFPAQLIGHSRNFGSFSAIRSGLRCARGKYFGVMAADLQEPPELLEKFYSSLKNDQCDVAIGVRESRHDPFLTKISSNIFWWVFRKFISPDMPIGGVDIFGCNKLFRDQLLKLEEARSSLIALVFWLGFRRTFITYKRGIRLHGKSSWTFQHKINYMMDSIFAFTDYPIRLLTKIGMVGFIISIILGSIVIIGRLTNSISTPGYAATIIVIMFFSTLNLFSLGLVGMYAWRGYENSKARPLSVISLSQKNLIEPNDK